MDKETLEQRLWSLRSDQARAEYLRRYIPLMQKRLEEMKEEALQALGRGRPLDQMPGAGPGDPTALLGMKAAEYALTEDMRAYRDRLGQLRRECALLEARNALTECLLASLPEEGRFLLTRRYVEHMRWPVLAREYEKQFHVDYTEQTLRRRAQRTISGLCGTAEGGEQAAV